MYQLPDVIQTIDGWLDAKNQAYPVWTKGYMVNQGLAWDFPLVRLSPEQITAVNAVVNRTLQRMVDPVYTTPEDYERALREAYLVEAIQLDAEAWQFGYQYLVESDGMRKLERRHERLFRRTRRLASLAGLMTYKTRLSWESVSSTSFDQIVVAPFESQYDILRTEGTRGNNYFLETDELISELISLDQAYGVIISGADETALEFWFKRAPTGQRAIEVGQRLMHLAPDIHETPDTFRSCVALWWD